jgi:glycosyltransferase 2 family protein
VVKPLFGLIVIAGAASTIWALWNDPSLDDFPSEIAPLPLLLGFLVKLTNSFVGATAWVVLFRGIGGQIGMRDGVRIYLVTSVAKYVPGKVTLVIARVAVLKEYGQSAAHGISSTVLELGFSLLAAATIAMVTFPLQPWASWSGAMFVEGIGVTALLVGLIVLHPRVMSLVLRYCYRVLPRWVTDAIASPPPYSVTLNVLTVNVLVRVFGACGAFAIVQSVYPLEPSWIPVLAGVSAISYLVGFLLPLAPAGLGARDGMMAALLSTIIPLPVAVAVTVVDRLASVLSELVAAGLALVYERIRCSSVTARGLVAVEPAPEPPAV